MDKKQQNPLKHTETHSSTHGDVIELNASERFPYIQNQFSIDDGI